MKFRTVKGHGRTYKFFWIIVFLNETFKYGDGAKFRGYVGTDSDLLCV
jgi:hypothetical protein